MKICFIILFTLPWIVAAQGLQNKSNLLDYKHVNETFLQVQLLKKDLNFTNASIDRVVSKISVGQNELCKEQYGLQVKINFLEIGFFTLIGVFFGGLGYSIFRDRQMKFDLKRDAAFIRLAEKVKYLERRLNKENSNTV